MSFKSLDSLQKTKEEAFDGNVRKFVGNDLPYLPVPGCKSIISVRLGTHSEPTPNQIEMKIPLNPRFDEFTRVKVPMWALAELEGETVLLRNELSNDGVFQAQEAFYVKAEWADESKGKK